MLQDPHGLQTAGPTLLRGLRGQDLYRPVLEQPKPLRLLGGFVHALFKSRAAWTAS